MPVLRYRATVLREESPVFRVFDEARAEIIESEENHELNLTQGEIILTQAVTKLRQAIGAGGNPTDIDENGRGVATVRTWHVCTYHSAHGSRISCSPL